MLHLLCRSRYHIYYMSTVLQGYKVPTSTNALVELMNMVERWRQRTDYGPVVVVSQDGISRYSQGGCGEYRIFLRVLRDF